MSELSPEARQLLDGTRGVGGPTAAQRLAMKKAVLGAVASPVAAPAGVKSALLAKISTAVVVIGAVGGAIAFKLMDPEPVETKEAVSRVEARADVVAAAPAPEIVPVEEAPPLPPAPEPVRAPVVKKVAPAPVIAEAPAAPPPPAPEPAPAPKVDEETLAKEVAAVSAAMVTVQNGNFDQALAEVETYQDDFPSGALHVEAAVVKVLALCGLKRVDEARAIAATVPASNPAARRLERSCIR